MWRGCLRSHFVGQSQVTLAPLQQQPCDVRVPPLGGEHQGRGSLAVLDVGVRSVAQQQANHHHPAVSHRQVQSRLARLRDRHIQGFGNDNCDFSPFCCDSCGGS